MMNMHSNRRPGQQSWYIAPPRINQYVEPDAPAWEHRVADLLLLIETQGDRLVALAHELGERISRGR